MNQPPAVHPAVRAYAILAFVSLVITLLFVIDGKPATPSGCASATVEAQQ